MTYLFGFLAVASIVLCFVCGGCFLIHKETTGRLALKTALGLLTFAFAGSAAWCGVQADPYSPYKTAHGYTVSAVDKVKDGKILIVEPDCGGTVWVFFQQADVGPAHGTKLTVEEFNLMLRASPRSEHALVLVKQK